MQMVQGFLLNYLTVNSTGMHMFLINNIPSLSEKLNFNEFDTYEVSPSSLSLNNYA